MAGRNDTCPCGSGKKYKHCCGANAAHAARQNTPTGFALAHQLFKRRDYAQATQVCEQALRAQPELADGWFLYSACLVEQQAYDRALMALQRLSRLAPKRPEVRFNMGHVHERRGDFEQAIAAYRAAVELDTSYAQGWNNLGNCLKSAGHIEDAIQAYAHAARLQPNNAAGWTNLGGAQKIAGHLDEAASSYERALACDPRYAPAHNNLGNLRSTRKDYTGAQASLREALRLDPHFFDAQLNLASVLRESGQYSEALAAYRQALRLQPDNARAWSALAGGLQGFRYTSDDVAGREELVRALAHPAIDPLDLVPVAVSLLRHTPALQPLLESEAAPPLSELTAWLRDPLLGALLETALIADWEMESALRRVRAALLRAACDEAPVAPDALGFATRLAAQCLLTDYVYLETPEEAAQLTALTARLETSLAQPQADAFSFGLAVYGCYRPLSTLPWHDRIQDRPQIATLLRMQLEAPREEAGLRAALKQLGVINNTVSRAVQAQYEEHPYPRWVRVGNPGTQALAQVVRDIAPQATLPDTLALAAPRVLVAGCGTGRHPIQTAQRIAGAQLLAIDLSSTSLGYAMRKAHEENVGNLEFMQADILALGLLEQEYDLVESFGVLHHMQDPMAGWRVLTGLVKPGGLMVIGLYSERARAPVVACREFVRTRGYASDAAGIRQFRQDLLREGEPEVVASIRKSPDFYSVSDCRDLIFHVQEHRYTLPQIAVMGESLGLHCLGLELDDRALYAGLPGDTIKLPAQNDLIGWDQFEQAHPQAFGSTYKIWWQRH